MIKEIFVLRSIGCLSIVFLHSIHIALQTIPIIAMGEVFAIFFDSLQMLLYYGTPMFIFISEFLISYSYRNKPLPTYFLSKRTKFILIPFFVMGVFYSLPFLLSGASVWAETVAMNLLLGDYHGYFILIIFQFYLFHYYFHSYLKKWRPFPVITIAFIINAIYLFIFNFTTPPIENSATMFLWERFYWVPMFGWVFYFAVGYYAGLYYESFMTFLLKYRYWIIVGPLVTSFILLFVYHSGILSIHSSKRIDILIHTIACSFFLFYLTSQMKGLPTFFAFISRYSFGIYLLHYFYIFAIDFIYSLYPIPLGVAYIMILFVFSTLLSIGTVYVLNKIPYGHIVIGKIGAPYKPPASSV
ncbi:acyltransferase family protein [Paenalkalicoccus suaedae]|uniref:Acyltransferase family protein n=1 Tax=Paenalkalicoccus suaedae TaxID=2592382 RepID=A0A859FFA2_9BACI|nr:acyltransferase family protein [Paenalkalicoccus suaedae]QKS71264.1 acyltransferase family protein [Paenalkalicoccus suaedae]